MEAARVCGVDGPLLEVDFGSWALSQHALLVIATSGGERLSAEVIENLGASCRSSPSGYRPRVLLIRSWRR
jgi:hypothetical protein